jgi:hypothetical protein
MSPMDVTTTDSRWRVSTLQALPLFSANPEEYRLDQLWRADIPKAGFAEIEAVEVEVVAAA